MIHRLAAHHQLALRHGHVDAHVIQLALVVAAMRRLDDDAAAHDAVVITVELRRPFADLGFDGCRGFHVAKADL